MAGIEAIEYVLPSTVVTNEELADLFKTWSPEKIFEKTGIRTRHIAGKNETAVDLAEKACVRLFENNNIKKDDIDFLILITQSPDYKLPTSACVLQQRLGLQQNVGAYDINLGCSGYIYGLATSKALIQSGMAKKVLLITAETYTKHINVRDRSTRTIFGDAAAATLVGTEGMEIGMFDFGTDGTGKELLIIPAGGERKPQDSDSAVEFEDNGNYRSENNLYMDGTGVFEFTINKVPDSLNKLLEKEKMNFDDVDLFVFHQANQFMLDFLRKKMKIDVDKFYTNFSDIGNTVSASIPIAIKRALDDGVIQGKRNIVLSGFGVGLSWGTTLLRRKDIK